MTGTGLGPESEVRGKVPGPPIGVTKLLTFQDKGEVRDQEWQTLGLKFLKFTDNLLLKKLLRVHDTGLSFPWRVSREGLHAQGLLEPHGSHTLSFPCYRSTVSRGWVRVQQ